MKRYPYVERSIRSVHGSWNEYNFYLDRCRHGYQMILIHINVHAVTKDAVGDLLQLVVHLPNA